MNKPAGEPVAQERAASAHWWWRDSTEEWVLEVNYTIRDELNATERRTEADLLAEATPPPAADDARDALAERITEYLNSPPLILQDEPLSNLDAKLRDLLIDCRAALRVKENL